MATQHNARFEVFFSYAHEDEALRDELEKHLSPLKREGIITGWHDRQIGAGEEWRGRIDEHLNSAQIILLLISADFLASDYCYDFEMGRAMKRHEAKEARVIPVILRECDWRKSPFKELQVLPKDALPVTSWPNRDEVFKNVAEAVRQVAEKLIAQQSLPLHEEKQTANNIGDDSWQRFWIAAILIALVLLSSAGFYFYFFSSRAEEVRQPAVPPLMGSASPATNTQPQRTGAAPLTAADGRRMTDSTKPISTDPERKAPARKLTFAVGASLAMLGQSSGNEGGPIFEKGMKLLGCDTNRIQELRREYNSLELQVIAKRLSSQAFERNLANLRDDVQRHLRDLASESDLSYLGFGESLSSLILLLRHWEEWASKPAVLSIASNRLKSIQAKLVNVQLPSELAKAIRALRADDWSDASRRAAAQRTLDETLSYFDLPITEMEVK